MSTYRSVGHWWEAQQRISMHYSGPDVEVREEDGPLVCIYCGILFDFSRSAQLAAETCPKHPCLKADRWEDDLPRYGLRG